MNAPVNVQIPPRCRVCCLTSTSLRISLSACQVDDLKRHRYDVADVLRDVCRILGGVECLRQVVFLLKKEVRRQAPAA